MGTESRTSLTVLILTVTMATPARQNYYRAESRTIPILGFELISIFPIAYVGFYYRVKFKFI